MVPSELSDSRNQNKCFLFGEKMETEPGPQFDIREATIDDVEAIRRMHAQSWRDTYQNDDIGVTKEWLEEETDSWLTDNALEKSCEKLGACFTDPTQFYRVVLRDEEVVGLLHLYTNEDGSKHLWGLYTAKNTYGSGLAQELMRLADEWIDGSEVDLEVVSYNERAKVFYRKYGFVELPGVVNSFKNIIPAVRMTRKVGTHE